MCGDPEDIEEDFPLTAKLWRQLAAEAPGLERLPVRFAVRERYVEPSYVVRQGDEVSIFPPVSGGA